MGERQKMRIVLDQIFNNESTLAKKKEVPFVTKSFQWEYLNLWMFRTKKSNLNIKRIHTKKNLLKNSFLHRYLPNKGYHLNNKIRFHQPATSKRYHLSIKFQFKILWNHKMCNEVDNGIKDSLKTTTNRKHKRTI